MGTGGSSTTGRIFGEAQIGHGEANVSMNYRPRISGFNHSWFAGHQEYKFSEAAQLASKPFRYVSSDSMSRIVYTRGSQP